jgi:hypothetical protein
MIRKLRNVFDVTVAISLQGIDSIHGIALPRSVNE